MPRQNRVTPLGEIIASPAQGTLMGNRGCLHNEQGQIIRPYQGKRWIICQLQFKERRRALMVPGHYTELFFLDEATALAAGHRPCAECSRPRFKEFVDNWVWANLELTKGTSISIDKLDAVLHKERIARKQKVIYPERLSNLPRGSFVMIEAEKQPYLVLEDALLAWQSEGYAERLARPDDPMVQVLTPRSIVRTLAYGYQANIHLSAAKITAKGSK